MDSKAQAESEVATKSMTHVAELIESSKRSPEAFEETLMALQNSERSNRLTSETTAAPIYANGIVSLYLAHGRVMDAIEAFATLVKRRAQMSKSVKFCAETLEKHLTDAYLSTDACTYSALLGLDVRAPHSVGDVCNVLAAFITPIDGVIYTEPIYIRCATRLMLLRSASGDHGEALRLAELIPADTAGSLEYIDRVEFCNCQVHVALRAEDHMKAALLSGKIKPKTLQEAYSAVADKGLGDLAHRFREARRVYHAALCDIALHDESWGTLARASFDVAKTYFEVLDAPPAAPPTDGEKAASAATAATATVTSAGVNANANANANERAAGDAGVTLSPADTAECAAHLSTAALTAFISNREPDNAAFLRTLKATAFFAPCISYCPLRRRGIAACINPALKRLLATQAYSWRAFAEAFSLDSLHALPVVQRTSRDTLSTLLKRAYIERSVVKLANYYASTTMTQLAAMVECDKEDLEHALVSLDIYVSIDRLTDVVDLQADVPSDTRLAVWYRNIRTAITNVLHASHLIDLETRK